MYKIFALFISILLIQNVLYAKTYYFENKSPEGGFVFDGITTIEEDKNGTIWFGASNGLYHYNSYSFHQYTSKEDKLNTLPDNNIRKVYRDNQSQLWVCTAEGLCKFNRATNDFTRIKLNTSVVRGQNHDVTDILQVNDSIYLCIINLRLYRYNVATEELSIHFFYNHSEKVQCKTMTKDNEGNIWIGLGGGNIFKTDTTLQSINLWHSFRIAAINSICITNKAMWIGYANDGIDKVGLDGILLQHYGVNEPAPFKLSNNTVRKVESRDNGEIWAGTLKGINVINGNDNHCILETTFNNLPHNSILDLMKDKNNGIWVATWAGGIAHYSEYNYYFRHIKKIPYQSEISRNTISSIIEDQSGLIFLGSENDGLKTYNHSNEVVNSIKMYDEDGDIINIKSLTIDKEGTIWMGTFENGLWQKKPGETKFRKEDHPFFKEKFIIHRIVPINKELWICTNGKGVLQYNPNNKTLKKYNIQNTGANGMLSDNVRSLTVDSKGIYWLSTEKGMCIKNPDSDTFQNLGNHDESYNRVMHSVCETNEGEIWVGTKNKGILVLDTTTYTFKPLEKEWNKELNEVFSIINDQSGNVWIASNLGIQMYNTHTKSILYFNENDGVLGGNFSPNASLCSTQGILFFGGHNGFNIIDPEQITLNPNAPDVLLSGISINNKPYHETTIESLKDKNIDAIKELELPYQQNSLLFTFVANNFIKSYKNNFKYKLVNYQDEWVDLKTKNEISFTKIPPGHYKLAILGSNNSGVWSTSPLEFPIHIKPPFWLTWYAFVIYILLILMVGYLIIKEKYFRIDLEKKMLLERLHHEAEEKLFADKQEFFTNISHEIRTPLTLILSPIDLLIQKFKYDTSTGEHLLTVKRNADRLLRLTNEFLDFRLIETGKIKFNPKQYDIIETCKSAYNCFVFEAMEREINFIFSSRYESLEISIDNNKMEKVIFNLLSNAFKYSEDKSHVLLSIESSHKTSDDYKNLFYTGKAFQGPTLEIKVINYGYSISEKQIPNIFERFSMHNNSQSVGTGLGLHISREYIRLHNGNISVTSSKSEGNTFIVNLPLEQEIAQSEKKYVIQNEAKDFAANQPFEDDNKLQKMQSDIVILIVEDNIDLKKYLKTTLNRRYKVLTASNGVQGYEIAQEIIPHLIISDIKMPVMDGTTMTKQLKENPKTRLIPIILLSAMADKTDQIKGIEYGADSYLTKPIEVDLLFAHIQNLLEKRKEISRQFNVDLSVEKTLQASHKEHSFIEKVELTVLENLLNPQFSVGHLAEKLDMSRSSLHRKVKIESGQSATEFIRDLRMKKTLELMKENKYSLEEIGTYVGFNSHSYFARTFKGKYGKTPKEIYNDIKANKDIKL